jgi:hypothetical protein
MIKGAKTQEEEEEEEGIRTKEQLLRETEDS